ncbi:MAG: S1C family serine protease [Thiotrichales bacterium]|nr:S1C family serine protease [Thiotrichales bacterium]
MTETETVTETEKEPGVELDVDAMLSSLVSVRSEVPEDALTASVLGTERMGNGVVIGDPGLVLTIGYLVTEAQTLWITDHQGLAVPGHVLGYDQESGFGLVQALQPLPAPAMDLGVSAACDVGDPIVLAGHGGGDALVTGRIIAKREFAGYWEYVLDEALFTAPAHPNWGGAALVGSDGRLLGVGSLLVQTVSSSGEKGGANMIVPIDLLKPILEDMKLYGRPNRPARPWLGVLVQDVGSHLVVASTYDGCPAERAGIETGDRIVEVAGESVDGLAELFRRVWEIGPAGSDVPLTIVRDGEPRPVVLESIDRNARLKHGAVH